MLDWVVIASASLLTGTLVMSWLATYRAPGVVQVGSSRWFAFPAWAQIGGGFAALVLFVFLGYILWLPLPWLLPSGVLKILRVFGVVLYLGGVFLVLWARRALGEMYSVSTSSAVQLKTQHRLVQHGPYAYVRHPLYLGIWLVFLGVALAYRTWASLIYFILFLSLYRRAQREEATLATALGDKWRRYAAEVPMFLPYWKKTGQRS